MIAFVMTDDHQYTIREVLETRRHALRGRLVILSYHDFATRVRLPVATYVFVDVERLEPEAIEAAAARLARLREAVPKLRVLNPPRPDLQRLQVMRRLHEAGINRFRVLPASAPDPGLRFPVFLRRLDDHEGPITGLLADACALARALARLAAKGIPLEALAVTEYVDARNAEGHHEKRCYFRVGEALFPVALDVSANWVCKGVVDDPHAVEASEREREFLLGEPHEAPLRAAFEAAGIDYGRADYAIVDGRPQVFEINTNPLIEYPERLPRAHRANGALVLGRWLDEVARLLPPDAAAPRWIPVGGRAAPAPPMPGPRGRHRLRRLVRALLAASGQMHRETAVMGRLRRLGIAR